MEDELIINLFWNRSETAITETSDKYSSYCRCISYNILNNIEDTEECENDTYTALWNTIPPTRPSNLKAYIGRLIRNISLDKLDYNKAKKRNSEMNVLFSELEECIADVKATAVDNDEEEIGKIVSVFLRSIDKDARCVFVRRYWYSDSIASISKRYNMSESKIKSMLFRTRRKLRLYLEKEGITV